MDSAAKVLHTQWFGGGEARMTPDAFIEQAIAGGERLGVAALHPDLRMVYLIAEAECLSDMEGVDSFLDRYAPTWLPEAASAFAAVGAAEIATELRAVPPDAEVGDTRLNRLNELVTARAGYDYESIRRVVAEHYGVAPDAEPGAAADGRA